MILWSCVGAIAIEQASASAVPQLPVNDVSPLWGKSYVEIGMEGHAHHRSQGTPALFGQPFFRRPMYLVAENQKGEEIGRFDPKLLAEPISARSPRDFPNLQSRMQPALASADQKLSRQRQIRARSGSRRSRKIARRRRQADRQTSRRACASSKVPTTPPRLSGKSTEIRDEIDTALAEDVALPVERQRGPSRTGGRRKFLGGR